MLINMVNMVEKNNHTEMHEDDPDISKVVIPSIIRKYRTAFSTYSSNSNDIRVLNEPSKIIASNHASATRMKTNREKQYLKSKSKTPIKKNTLLEASNHIFSAQILIL